MGSTFSKRVGNSGPTDRRKNPKKEGIGRRQGDLGISRWKIDPRRSRKSLDEGERPKTRKQKLKIKDFGW